jgi:hypothetical protein
MYPKRLTCAAPVAVFSVPQPVHRLAAANEADGKLRRAFASPDTLTIAGGTSVGLQPGQQFFVRRMLQSPNHEKPSLAVPGIVHTAGWITVISADESAAVARIDHACDHFIQGDFLEPFTPVPMPATIARPGQPTFVDMGQLLFGTDGRRSFANGDLIVINRGASHGLAAGARLAVFRDPGRGAPLVAVGHAIVLTVGADTATVVAERVRGALATGDWVSEEAADRPF